MNPVYMFSLFFVHETFEQFMYVLIFKSQLSNLSNLFSGFALFNDVFIIFFTLIALLSILTFQVEHQLNFINNMSYDDILFKAMCLPAVQFWSYFMGFDM